jgi:hypothetical protein
VYLSHINTQRRIDMGKQLYFFQKEVIEEVEIWHRLPEVRRSKIERRFAKLLIKYLHKSIEETPRNEK